MSESTAQRVLRALEPYKLKQEGTNKYRCNSPLRPGSDSHSFVVTITDGESGVYCDHADNDRGGSLYELARHLGIEVPTREVESTKRAYTGLADYARAHGLPPEALTKAGWEEKQCKNRPALQFPTKHGLRWRFMDGKKPHYISQPDFKRSWYGLDEKAMSRVLQGQPLVITNGEISVLTGRYYNLAAVAITGGEKREIPHDLMPQIEDFMGDATLDPKNPPLIIIALDCDPAGRKGAAGIKEQLQAKGYNVKALDLRLGKGGDLADFCMLHGERVGEALLQLPLLPDLPVDTDQFDRNWVIVHASELENLPPIQWLIPGEIPEHGLCVLFGQSGAGKSFLALDYALRLAQKLPVVYIAAEGESGYPQRIAAWTKHHNQSVGKLYICLGAVNIFDPDDFDAFVNAITGYHACFVVVDTLAMCMSGDENDAKAMGSVIRACKRMMRDLSCTVMMVHHVNKGGIAERGSTALRGACDMMIKVTPDDDIIRMECSKTKDTAAFQPRYMKLLPVALGMDADGREIASPVIIEAEKVIQTNMDRLTTNQQKILEALNLEIYKDGAEYGQIEKATDVPEKSVPRILSALLKLGFIQQPGKREPYTITDTGRESLIRSLRLIRSLHDDSPDQFKTTNGNGESTESTESTESSQVTMFGADQRHQYSAGL